MKKPAAANASPIAGGIQWHGNGGGGGAGMADSVGATISGDDTSGSDPAIEAMRKFFADRLSAGLTLKETHAQWREKGGGAKPFQLAGNFLDWMRDGHQYYCKYGRLEERLSAVKALEKWKAMSERAKEKWHRKSHDHNAVILAMKLSDAGRASHGKAADLTMALIGDIKKHNREEWLADMMKQSAPPPPAPGSWNEGNSTAGVAEDTHGAATGAGAEDAAGQPRASEEVGNAAPHAADAPEGAAAEACGS